MRFSVFATLVFIAFSNAGLFNHIQDSWSFDLDEEKESFWMSRMRDDVPLSQLVIPGTHGSMTDSVDNSLFQTQNVPLAQQLIGGIRYIEITCRYMDQKMAVYHRNADTGYSLDNVLTTLYDFLDHEPSETIILRIQESGMFDFNTFFDSMEGYFAPGSELGDRAVQHIYVGNSDDATLPTLGEARGKVVILQDFKSSPRGPYGIPWDLHTVSSHSSGLSLMGLFLRFKWATVKKHISLDRLKDSDKLRITHTIANAGIEPIRVAAQNGNNPGMNEFLGRYLFQEEGECFGIIVMDFPGCDLVDQILKRNKHNRLRNPISYADQNAMDSADEADFNYTRTADGADLNNEITAEGVDFNAADTAEEFDFTLISDFEPPSPEDSDDDSSDDEYRDH